MNYNYFHSRYHSYSYDKDLEQVSTAFATIGGLFFVVWLVSLSNIFSLRAYSLIFFGASVTFLFVARVIRKNSVASKLSELVALSLMYLIVLYPLAFFGVISDQVWTFAINTLLFLCIVLGGIAAFAIPSTLRKSLIDYNGCIILSITIVFGTLWYFYKANLILPYSIQNLVYYLTDNDRITFFGLLASMGVGFTFRGFRFYKEGILPSLSETFRSFTKFSISLILFLLVMSFLVPTTSSFTWAHLNTLVLITIITGIIAAGLSSFHVEELDLKIGPIERKISTAESKTSFSPFLESLKPASQIFKLAEECLAIDTSNFSLTLSKGNLILPLIDDHGAKRGLIAFGNGTYSVTTNIKEINSEFYGDLILLSPHESIIEKICHDKLVEIPLSLIDTDSINNIEATAIQRLDELRKWKPKRHKISGKVGYEKTRIRLPFIDINVDEYADYADVRIGPIHVKTVGDRSIVKLEPFLMLDDSSRMLREGNLIGMLTDEHGDKINFAIKNGSFLFNKGDLDIYITKTKTVIYDKDIKIVFAPETIYIKAKHFKLTLAKESSLVLKSGDMKLVIESSGSIVIKSSTGEKKVYKNVATAMKLLSIIEEMAVDLAKEILENRELESLSKFLRELDETFKGE
ncbi:MAG: hypothetical protein ACP6IS_07110 [Candidatus Asgardarchaeia archaeon]